MTERIYQIHGQDNPVVYDSTTGSATFEIDNRSPGDTALNVYLGHGKDPKLVQVSWKETGTFTSEKITLRSGTFNTNQEQATAVVRQIKPSH